MSGKVTLEKYAEIKKELNKYPDHNLGMLANKFHLSVDTIGRIRKTDDYLGYRQFWKDEYQHRLDNYRQKWLDELRFASRINPLTIIFAVIATVLAVLCVIYLIGGIK